MTVRQWEALRPLARLARRSSARFDDRLPLETVRSLVRRGWVQFDPSRPTRWKITPLGRDAWRKKVVVVRRALSNL